MKTAFLLFTMLSAACSGPHLIRICDIPDGAFIFGAPAGYVTPQGDTVVPVGKYLNCYTDTIRRFGVVAQHAEDQQNDHDLLIAIDAAGHKRYNVYRFDNGPDYPCDGLFRITDDRGLIGYADTTGRVVIRPRFEAAGYFTDGHASVSLKATVKQDGEYFLWVSDEWFQIDRKGRKVAGE